MVHIFLEGFKVFLEQKLRDMDKNKDKKKEKENHLDSLSRELSISPNMIPDLLDVPQVDFTDENLRFNEVIFKVKKPISLDDPYVVLNFYNMKSPNLNQHVWRLDHKGNPVPYEGSLEGLKRKPFLIPMDKFAEMFSRAWQSSMQGNQAPAGLGGGLI